MKPARLKVTDVPAEEPRVVSPDGATPVGDMTLSGVVKTSKGYAVATATIAPDGSATVRLSHSQSSKEFVAAQQKRTAQVLAVKA